jgi:hypothetical protein
MVIQSRKPRFLLGWVLLALVVFTAIVAFRHHTTDVTPALPVSEAAPTQPTAPARPIAGHRAPPPGPIEAIEAIEAHEARLQAAGEKTQQRWREGYATNPVDPAWAAATEKKVFDLLQSDTFAASGAKPRDLSIDCKSTMCQIKATFGSNAEAQDFSEYFSLYGAGLFAGGATSLQPNADGQFELAIIAAAHR